MKWYMQSYLTVLLSLLCTAEGGQECLSCSSVESADSCHHRIQCSDNEVCYMQKYMTESGALEYDYGCSFLQACTNTGGSILGRRSEGRHVICTVCCQDSRLCNEVLNCSSAAQTPTYLPRECAEVRTNGRSGVYTIYPYGRPQPAVPVYCQIDTTGHAWTVIQRRFNGTVNFYRNWEAYKHGFGQPGGEYWLGNDIIHVLTSDANHALMINMTDFSGVSKFAEYLSFHVSSEENGYSLMVSKYDGNAGDSFTRHNGQKFSTFDRDNDSAPGNCATLYKGAWWYENCHASNLNGMYLKGQHAEYATGVNWVTWHGYHYSLQSTEMMIRKY